MWPRKFSLLPKTTPKNLDLFSDLIIPKRQQMFISGGGIFCLGQIKRELESFALSENLLAVTHLQTAKTLILVCFVVRQVQQH